MFDVIHSYTQTQALEDGELIPISQALLKEAGIRYPAVITRSLHALLTPTCRDEGYGQSFEGRFWDLLMLFRVAAKRATEDLVVFRYEIWRNGTSEAHKLYAHLGPDDHSQPVLTFMFPDEW